MPCVKCEIKKRVILNFLLHFSLSGGSPYFCQKARKMKSAKKPDGVAWNEETQEYISKLLPYATSNSSPVINIPNVDAFKQKGVEKVSKQFQAELEDLQTRIKKFVTLAADTQRVYSAKFKFEPIVGSNTTYMLEKR